MLLSEYFRVRGTYPGYSSENFQTSRDRLAMAGGYARTDPASEDRVSSAAEGRSTGLHRAAAAGLWTRFELGCEDWQIDTGLPVFGQGNELDQGNTGEFAAGLVDGDTIDGRAVGLDVGDHELFCTVDDLF